MKDLRFALPGFMPATKPVQDSILVFDWEAPVELILFERPAEEPDQEVEMHIRLQGQERLILKQSPATMVHVTEEGLKKVYTLHIPARKLPAGCHELQASIPGKMTAPVVLMNIPRTLANERMFFRLLPETKLGASMSSYILLFNPQTGVYYRLGTSENYSWPTGMTS